MRSRARAIFDRVSTIACGGEKKWRVAPQRIAWTSHQIISDLMERPSDIIVHRYIKNELIFLGRREDGVWGWRSREKRENAKKKSKKYSYLYMYVHFKHTHPDFKTGRRELRSTKKCPKRAQIKFFERIASPTRPPTPEMKGKSKKPTPFLSSLPSSNK